MKTVIFSNYTYGSTLIVGREVLKIPGISLSYGSIKSVKITVPLWSSTTVPVRFKIYIFGAFSTGSDWTSENDYIIQTPDNANSYLRGSMMGAIKASGSFYQTITTGMHTFDLDVSDYGSDITTWGGKFFVGIVEDNNHTLYWDSSKLCSVAFGYDDGTEDDIRTVKYGVNGSFRDCEVYYATGGSFVKVVPYFATGGSFAEIGG